MKRIRLVGHIAVVLYALVVSATMAAEPYLEAESVSPAGTVRYKIETQEVIGSGGVRVRYYDEQGRETILTANQITYHEPTGQATAEGAVTLRREGQLWTTDRIEYNFITREMKSESFRTGMAPFYATGMRLTLDATNQVYTATNAVITTDDWAEPGYTIRAKSMSLIPGKSIEAKGATLYLGKVPVMYFPRYQRSLARHPNNFVLTPGYRSLYGPYLLTRYNWYGSEHLSGALNLDYRQLRGVGVGPDLHYDLGRWGIGNFSYYYTHDEQPDTDPTGRPIRDYRHRTYFDHQATLRTNLTVKAAVREQSDAFFIRDFFENEYRQNVQPSSFVEVNQLWRNFSLNVLARPRVNTFFETVERLPDVKLTALRQQLGVSPFFYEGENSAGYFRYKYADNSQPSYAALRADSYHQIVLPRTFFGWLNVTPRVGGRFTHYGETESRSLQLDAQSRWVFNTGAEVSTKLSRLWPNVRRSFWDLDGLRHIMEPSVNYVFVPSPSRLPPQLPQFDTELPSFRLLPIEYPDYNAIDSVDSQNVLRLGLRNKLQTKRKHGLDNLVHWALYTDWRIKPRSNQSTYADFYSDLDLKPWSWLTFTSQTRYSLADERWNEANHYATIQPRNDWSLSLGHRFVQGDPRLGPNYALGDNLITTRLFYRLNENWAMRVAHHFQARDGRMEEQYYTVYRDLRFWTTALTFRLRESRLSRDDFTVAITFSLKAFPRFRLGSDSDTPALLLGG